MGHSVGRGQQRGGCAHEVGLRYGRVQGLGRGLDQVYALGHGRVEGADQSLARVLGPRTNTIWLFNIAMEHGHF